MVIGQILTICPDTAPAVILRVQQDLHLLWASLRCL
jgi:hypothetical protein